MNYRMIIQYVSLILKLVSVFMAVMLAVALIQGEQMSARGFFATLCMAVTSFLLLRLIKYEKKTMYIKDGFIAVAVSWITFAIVGAFPFWISGEIPLFVDALFESTSGITTTGASILTNIEGLSSSLLVWRSFTHWIGGMGVLVFLIALVPAISGGEHSMNVMRAEMPGPAPGKLVPKLRQNSKILYKLYIWLTVLLVIFLLAGGMPFFDSLLTAFSVAGTGGFAVKNISIAAYGSTYIDIVISVFMVLFGVNFNVIYFFFNRNFAMVRKNEEFRLYLAIVVGSSALIAWNIIGNACHSLPEALHYAFFTVASVITSTGFATVDYNLWPTFSKSILFILMFVGASAGSTGGGIKVSRILILVREARRILFRISHPRSVDVVKMDGKTVEKTVVHAVNAYLSTFFMVFFLSLLLISLDGFDFETTISAAAASINNTGPGFGIAGPMGNYSTFSPLSKIVLSLNMLIGRLEIYPMLLLISPRSWKKL